MKILRLLIVLATFIGLSIPAFSQVLWQSAETGMSVAQIKENFPKAEPPEKPVVISNLESESLLHVPGYEIGSNTFDIQFLFKSGALTAVRMGNVSGHPTVGFDNIKKLLKIKYGEPINSQVTSYGQTITWANEGITIELSTSMNRYLSILYFEHDNVEANKL